MTMKLTIRQLRKFISEQVSDNNTRLAGGVGSDGTVDAPPGLGPSSEESEYELEHGKQQEKPQAGVRVFDRNG